jgi:hypothetical protein
MCLQDENLGRQLKQRFKETYGAYPVLEVRETNFDPEMDEIHGSNFGITLNTEKLDEIEDWELRYVRSILLTATMPGKTECFGRFRSKSETSRKYSFQDTPSWWDKMVLNELPEDCMVIEVDVLII